MVFDWHKAARLIKERKPKIASAGLSQDWDKTGGVIWQDGAPVANLNTYLASKWAIPEINIDGVVIECMKLKHEPPEANQWDAKTNWPDSALEILNSE